MKPDADNTRPILSDYEKSINALIPAAESEADLLVAAFGKKSEIRIGVDGAKFAWSFWTEFYHKAMTRMASEAGLR